MLTIFDAKNYYGNNFCLLQISWNYGCPLQGIFHNVWNFGPDIHTICGITTIEATRISKENSSICLLLAKLTMIKFLFDYYFFKWTRMYHKAIISKNPKYNIYLRSLDISYIHYLYAPVFHCLN